MLIKNNDMALASDFKISENQGETKEGYLICYNVPVARIGMQEYTAAELGLSDRRDEIIKVYRHAEDVFSKKAMASAEGKPVTFNHPSEHLDLNNHSIYSKGHGQNVRRAGDYLLMDLVITDYSLIKSIKNGMRQVSLGYECEFVAIDKDFKQVNIRVNHIAIVDKGRAGPKASIIDSAEGIGEKMKTKEQVKMAAIKAFAADANNDPSDLATLMDILGDGHKEPEKVADRSGEFSLISQLLGFKKASANDDDKDKAAAKVNDLEKQVSDLKAIIDELMNAAPGKDETDVDDEDEDENVDDMEHKTDDEEENETDDMESEEKEANDSAELLKAVKKSMLKLKPKDQAMFKKQLAPFLGRTNDNQKAAKVKKIALAKAQDSTSKTVDYAEISRKIAEKHNPHYGTV